MEATVSLYRHTVSGPPGTVHGPSAIYERGQGLGFR